MIVEPVVAVFFGLTSSADTYFVLDSATRGVLDNTTYLLGGDIGTDISDQVVDVHIRRGRSRELDEITTGTCGVALRNFDRAFDPANAAGPYYGNLRPGKQVQVSVYGVTIYSGAVDEWTQGFFHGGRADAAFVAVDSLGQLARRDFDEWTTTGGQTAGPRIVDVLNRAEVAWGANRDLDTGVSTLQADVVSWGSNVLNYLQLVAKSDLGRLFDSRSGVLTFRDRHSVITATLAASFADDGTAFGFSGAQPRSSSELFFNRVSVDREGGIAQTKTDAAAVAQDGTRSLSVGGLLLEDDGQSADMADFLLNLYKEPDSRLAQLSIPVHRLGVADQAVVARIELGDVVNVVWTPNGVGAAIDVDLVVEGLEHQMGIRQGHVMRLALSNTSQRLRPFILDDVFFGVLDENALTF